MAIDLEGGFASWFFGLGDLNGGIRYLRDGVLPNLRTVWVDSTELLDVIKGARTAETPFFCNLMDDGFPRDATRETTRESLQAGEADLGVLRDRVFQHETRLVGKAAPFRSSLGPLKSYLDSSQLPDSYTRVRGFVGKKLVANDLVGVEIYLGTAKQGLAREIDDIAWAQGALERTRRAKGIGRSVLYGVILAGVVGLCIYLARDE